MAKQDTVNRYLEEYLAGKTPEKREKFLARSVDRQYQSIMTWRYQQRRKNADAQKEDFVGALREIRKRLDKVDTLSEERVNEIIRELDNLKQYMVEYDERCREKEIKRLEDQQSEIAARLEALRK